MRGAPAAPDDALRGAASLVFVADLEAPALSDEDEHHVCDVLRVEPGEVVAVADGSGAWRQATVRRVTRGRRSPGPRISFDLGDVRTSAAPAWPVTVAFAPPSRQRAELVVEKLTELGVDTIVPVITRRTSQAHIRSLRPERLARIARAACAQSRRLVVPVIAEPQPLAVFLEAVPGAAIASFGGGALPVGARSAVIGPEGGFDEVEIAGAPAFGLGPSVLRAETASIVAAALLVARRAGVA